MQVNSNHNSPAGVATSLADCRAILRLLPLIAWITYAILLAITISRHEMWSDELQAFLIVRDSHSLVDLFHNLRYEGHPLLWYLILYIPAHLTTNPVVMQVIQYLIAIASAALVLSAVRVPLMQRVLVIFSFTLFFGYGVISRSYMLSVLLLVGAVICFYGSRPRPRLALVFLLLAINTHFFAVPLAGLLAIRFFLFERRGKFQTWARLLTNSRTLLAAFAIFSALAIAYVTIRPPADIFLPHYDRVVESFWSYLASSFGGSWAGIFIPLPQAHLSTHALDLLEARWHPTFSAGLIAGVFLLILTASLRTRSARIFLLFAFVIECILFAVTVHHPGERHYGYLYVTYVLALMLDAYSINAHELRRSRFHSIAQRLIFGVLVIQAAYGIYFAVLDWREPYSFGFEASQWLKEQHLDQGPIFIVGSHAISLFGYLERPSVHYLACDCDGSFYKFARSWDADRPLTTSEFQRYASAQHDKVVLITSQKLTDAEVESLGIHEVKEFSGTIIGGTERYFIYQQNSQ